MNPELQLRELGAERKRLADEAQAILTRAADESKRALTPEEESRFDAIHKDIDERLEPAIARLQKQIDLDERRKVVDAKLIAGDADTDSGQRNKKLSRDPKERREQERSAFHALLRFGPESLDDEERGLFGSLVMSPVELRKLFEEGQDGFDQELSLQLRALAAGTGNVGGYTVPTTLVPELINVMVDSSALLKVSSQITTTSGEKMQWPTFDDTSERGELVAEAGAHTADATTPFGQQEMDSFLLGSKVLKTSVQLLQDSGVDIEALIPNALAGRLGRGINYYGTVGTGSSQPKGIVPASSLGKTGASGQTSSILYTDTVDMQTAVGERHARAQGAGWMSTWNGRGMLMKVLDSQNRPIWGAGDISKSEPDTLAGWPLHYNYDMAVPAASAKSLLFGNFKAFRIRLVRSIIIVRFQELFMGNLQVGFLAFIRFDSDLLDGGDGAVVHYVHPAS